ncbi:MAG: methyltransferase domain-containing protein [Candidatus Dormibacteraeota bacterium]|nr:methyltransferase domain-containing protein [Candidatus Dormibacteraeota bacterium]
MPQANGGTGAAGRKRPFRTAAPYYRARPPYSAELRPALAARLGWNGSGRLLDVGCGPGVLALELAAGFAEVVGLDPEPEMLAEARAAAAGLAAASIRWVEGRAEDIPSLGLGSFDAVTMGQSFHRTDRDVVARITYDTLKPGGAMLLVHHTLEIYEDNPPLPVGGPPHPPIPHAAIDPVLERYLGHGRPPADPNAERHETMLRRTPFGAPEMLILPGRRDLVRSVDDVIDNYLSTSFAAPELFGDRFDDFRAELGRVLAIHTDTGFFWEWPGDTEVLIGVKSVGGAVTARSSG